MSTRLYIRKFNTQMKKRLRGSRDMILPMNVENLFEEHVTNSENRNSEETYLLSLALFYTRPLQGSQLGSNLLFRSSD